MSVLFTATSDGRFSGGGIEAACALGKGGVTGALLKREGDGASPLGVWPIRYVFYRPDRTRAPETGLPAVPLRPHDGWCDAPGHPLYNRPVSLPFPASHERLWRDDPVYDLIAVLGYNDVPAVSPRGSAIFLHLAHPDYRPTEGCIALADADLRAVLAVCEAGSALEIRV